MRRTVLAYVGMISLGIACGDDAGQQPETDAGSTGATAGETGGTGDPTGGPASSADATTNGPTTGPSTDDASSSPSTDDASSGTTEGSSTDGSSSDDTTSGAGMCGDGILDLGEACDDGDAVGGDGCEPDCTPTITVTVGDQHNCARSADGAVRCWGFGYDGQLGYSSDFAIIVGAEDTAMDWGDVEVGSDVETIAAGDDHTCAIVSGGDVMCWGSNEWGQLGLPGEFWVGTPMDGGVVDLGGVAATQISAGSQYTCAVLADATLRCWGRASNGALGHGLGGDAHVGDDEVPADIDPVDVGADVVRVATGFMHACAILEGGDVKCWGNNEAGKLGYADTIGRDRPDADVVDLGGAATDVSLGLWHGCALLDDGAVRCWGDNFLGLLGYANLAVVPAVGDDEDPADAGDVDVGGAASAIDAGMFHTCVVLVDGGVRCWGGGATGLLGYVDNTEHIGDDETPASMGDVDIGGEAMDVGVGSLHTCATLSTGAVRCWGEAELGQLGYGNTVQIGDDETPASAGDVPLW